MCRSSDDILELAWEEGERPELTLPEEDGAQDQVQLDGGSGRNSSGGIQKGHAITLPNKIWF